MSPGAENLIELREALKLSQEEFGRRIGTSASHVCYVEGGKRHVSDSLQDFLRISYGLNLNLAQRDDLERALLLSPRLVRIEPSAPREMFLLLAALRDC